MELTKKLIQIGNSQGILIPLEHLGKYVIGDMITVDLLQPGEEKQGSLLEPKKEPESEANSNNNEVVAPKKRIACHYKQCWDGNCAEMDYSTIYEEPPVGATGCREIK